MCEYVYICRRAHLYIRIKKIQQSEMFGCFGLITPIQFPSFRRHDVRPSRELIDRQEKINIFQQANHPQLRTSTVKLIRFPWSLHVEAIFYPQTNYPTSSYKWDCNSNQLA